MLSPSEGPSEGPTVLRLPSHPHQEVLMSNFLSDVGQTSWAEMSASSSWCFFSRLFTDARSFP